ncbi:MAG: hypothetical protein JXR07_17975 [Reichenbachiella sp.]
MQQIIIGKNLPILNLRTLAWLILFLSALPFISFSQHEGHEEGHNISEEDFKHHSISIALSHTHVPKAIDNQSLIVPSWGLNYNYHFSPKWAIGIHSDLEIATYIIEGHDEGQELERENPIIVSVVGIYNPWKELLINVGFGKEFEPHESFWVYRFGLEYEIEFGHHWGLAPSLMYDIKESLFDSWTVGLVVGKRF